MAPSLRSMLTPCAGLIAALLLPSVSAATVDVDGCPVGADPIVVPAPNPDGSVRFTVGFMLYWEQDGTCNSLHFDQTFTVPHTEPCEAPGASPNGDGSWHYRVGAGVSSTGTNGGACLGDGSIAEGDTPAVPNPPECDLAPEPILEPTFNPDGSIHFVVGFVLRWQDAGECHSLHVDETFTVPYTEPCQPDADAEPNGDGSYHYRVGVGVRSTGTNGGACMGALREGDTPAP